MSSQKKFKTALDETRLLMLGSQIFFGFQFNGIFQTAFDSIPAHAKMLDAAALLLMSLTIGLLIAPSAYHRLMKHGHIDHALMRATTIFAGLALLPFSLSLAIDIYIVMGRLFQAMTALAIAAFFWVTALVFWYALEFLRRERIARNSVMAPKNGNRTALWARIDELLTEARVALPGAQALLAFQLLAVMTQAFERLPRGSQLLHAAALGSVALAVILLMAPAAFHRIAFNGADSEDFYRIGSRLVTAALFPLAIGMAGDIYVATAKLTANNVAATAASIGIFLLLISLWYACPLILPRSQGKGAAA
jgi:hypothetical protein